MTRNFRRDGRSTLGRLAMASCLASPFFGSTLAADPPPAVDPGVPRLATIPGRELATGRAAGTVFERAAVTRARAAVGDCREVFKSVQDYTCTFTKRERVDGVLSSTHVLTMKARTAPSSVYFRFVEPTPGREAIYVSGRDRNRVLVHDVGFGKLLAGTIAIDPRGSRAMDGCRHPITEAGLGALLETVSERWAAELKPGETEVRFAEGVRVGGHPCLMIETTHPTRRPEYLFHRVRLAIDPRLGLPVRFQAYEWPRTPGGPAELVEEYTYLDLKTNVGLRDSDFDPANARYSFGRF